MADSIPKNEIQDAIAEIYRGYVDGENEAKEDASVHGDASGVHAQQREYNQGGQDALRRLVNKPGISMSDSFDSIHRDEEGKGKANSSLIRRTLIRRWLAPTVCQGFQSLVQFRQQLLA